MKAVIAVLLLAVAVAHAGLVATQYTALTAPALGLGLGLGAPIAAPLAYAHAPAAIASPLAYAAAPIAYAAPAAIAAPVPVAGASYVAATRGAVHTAPLPGHLIGSQHVNVAPAPGTI